MYKDCNSAIKFNTLLHCAALKDIFRCFLWQSRSYRQGTFIWYSSTCQIQARRFLPQMIAITKRAKRNRPMNLLNQLCSVARNFHDEAILHLPVLKIDLSTGYFRFLSYRKSSTNIRLIAWKRPASANGSTKQRITDFLQMAEA